MLFGMADDDDWRSGSIRLASWATGQVSESRLPLGGGNAPIRLVAKRMK